MSTSDLMQITTNASDPVAITWSNCPSTIFDHLSKYLTQKHLQNLRLVNRYYNSFLIPHCYASIKVDVSSSNFIKKIPYGKHCKKIKLDARLCDTKSICKLFETCPNLTKFVIRCNEVEFCKLYGMILELWGNRVESLQFCKNPSNLVMENKWISLREAFQGAKKLRKVDLAYSSGVDFILKVIDPSSVNSLQLPLNIDSEVSTFLGCLPKFENLTSLDLSSYYCIEDYPVTPNLINPSTFLNLPHLTDLNLEIIVDAAFFPNNQLLEQVHQQKQKLLVSSNRLKLTNLKWVIRHSWHFSTSAENLSLIDNLNWSKLTQLNLYSIGQNLLTYIIRHCPNLENLQMSSALPLPIQTNDYPLLPLQKLRKLSCGSFSKEVVENSSMISALFPQVMYFCMLETNYGLRNKVQDPSAIPLLFPNLQIVWFLSHRVDFKSLICAPHPTNQLNWTQLALKYDHFKSEYSGDINLVLEKLPNLQTIIIWDRVFAKVFRKQLNLEGFKGNLYKGFYFNRNPFEYHNLVPVD